MDTDKIPSAQPSPWQPESNPLLIAVYGKAIEELSELSEVITKILLWGIADINDATGKDYRTELMEETADCLCQVETVVKECNLIELADFIEHRKNTTTGAVWPFAEESVLAFCQKGIARLQIVLARCLIQGLHESDPRSQRDNRLWLAEEIGNFLGYLDEVLIECNMGELGAAIEERQKRKFAFLGMWLDSLRPKQIGK